MQATLGMGVKMPSSAQLDKEILHGARYNARLSHLNNQTVRTWQHHEFYAVYFIIMNMLAIKAIEFFLFTS